MSDGALKLFAIGQRGNDLVNKPQDLDEAELTQSQNAEISSVGGGGALDQRPGMSKINATPFGAGINLVLDVPSPLLSDVTAYLYAAFYNSATHNWRRSSDGVTWVNDDSLVKPFSGSANIALFGKNFPKCATVGRKMYYVDGSNPINVHSFDGVNDVIVASIPPAVSGTTLLPPSVFPPDSASGISATYEGPLPTNDSYTYKFVAVNAAGHSAASAASTTAVRGPLGGNQHVLVALVGTGGGVKPVPAGATAIDVYRTVGGATQGKIGTIPIVAGALTLGNGGTERPDFPFTDDGLVGDGATPPSTTTGGAQSGNAIAVLDLITDGSNLYLAVLDAAGSDPSPAGRILQYNVQGNAWMQLGAAFSTAAGNGTASALALFDGAFSFGTYIGLTTGNPSYLTGLGTPLPAGGVTEVHATANSLCTCSLAVFNGALYVGLCSLVAATAALVIKRIAPAVWSTSLTAGATAALNAFTSLFVFNGLLFAGWTSGGGATAANIKSTPDGVTWNAEITLDVAEVVCQMASFGGSLYVVCGKTGVSYNTKSRVLKRTAAGVWSTVDDPSDDLAGCLGVVYF